MTRFPHALFGFALCAAVALAADPADPVAAKLARAKEAYGTDMAKFQQAVLDALDAREAAARKAGDKKAVDQIKAERDAMTTKGALPATLPMSLKQRQAAIRTGIESAYAAAIREYTRTKQDDHAGFLEKELKHFRSTGSLFVPSWVEVIPPGDYRVKYSKLESVTTLRADGTARRKRSDGKAEEPGTIEFQDGKVLLRHEKHTEEWTKEGAAIRVRHFNPAGEYPNGKSQTGTAVRVEKK